ncbi:MAG: isoprenylcysteine carboxylmethyltransferase family protein [Wenzhouxiangellaceae bacterium]
MLQRLELKIPPALLLPLGMLLIWLLDRTLPQWRGDWPGLAAAAAVLAGLGLLVIILGVIEFRRHRTTVNPMAPDQAGQIVSSGIFSYSRNPMYLGFILILLGYGAHVGNPAAVIVVIAVAAWLQRFQIIPEERILRQKFGQPYEAYQRSVRRWL